MTEQIQTPSVDAIASRREDIFVSVCFSDLISANSFDEISNLAKSVALKYRYWEILIVVDAAAAQDFQPLMQAVENIRMIKVRTGVQPYQRRVIAALEAIGDIVLLSSVHEIQALNLVDMIEQARRENSVVIGIREQSTMLNPAILALGNISGFRATARDMASAAYPRTLLNRLLAHPDRQLVLRFLPRDSTIPVINVATVTGPQTRTIKDIGRRIGLIQRLLVNAAPRVLALVSILAAVTAITAFFFALYAVGVWVSLDTIQPGWLTTSLAISLTTSFLGVAIFGLSSGLQKLIELVSPEPMQDVIGEESSGDLFGQVIHELNVEVELDTPPTLENHRDLPLDPDLQKSGANAKH